MDDIDVLRDIQNLKGKLSARENKYLRNLNWFLANVRQSDTIRELYVTPVAYYKSVGNQETGTLPAINVGRSIALTLQSKLIQTKGRVFFNGVNGLWKTIKLIRNAQIYFDAFLERDSTTAKAAKCLLDALIFEIGIMWTDEETKQNYRIKPWDFYVDPAEFDYGKVSRCFVEFQQYPLNALDKKLVDKSASASANLKNDQFAKGTIQHYWDLKGGSRYLVVNGEVVSSKKISYSQMPFSLIYYNEPLKGFYSTSVMDNVYQNQRQIDDILIRIHDALTLSPANSIFVPYNGDPTNADRMAKIISNKVGNVYTFNAAGGGIPVVSTPAPFDQSYISTLEFFINKTYEQEGVSQLSATSKKPSGINSGVALDTLQDVESERFQFTVDNYINFYKSIYNTMIEVFDAADDILPKRLSRARISWGEIKKNKDSYSLQSSLASVLSQDPKVKMEQIEKLQQMQIINPDMSAQLLQIPDLDRAYSVATASYDYCMQIIETAIETGKVNYLPVVNMQQLLNAVVNTLCQLAAEGEDEKILNNLTILLNAVMADINNNEGINNPAPPEPPPIRWQAQEINAVAETLKDVNAGAILPGQAAQMLQVALPDVDPNLLGIMIQPELGGQPAGGQNG